MESKRRYITTKDSPKAGDAIILHGALRQVKEVRRGKVTLDNGTWYYVESLQKVRAYYA